MATVASVAPSSAVLAVRCSRDSARSEVGQKMGARCGLRETDCETIRGAIAFVCGGSSGLWVVGSGAAPCQGREQPALLIFTMGRRRSTLTTYAEGQNGERRRACQIGRYHLLP